MARTPIAQALALCALLAQGAAGAASTTATLRIGLTVTASCKVDSAALTRRDSPERRRKAAVNCGVEAPYAVKQTQAGPVRVVTLVF